MSDLKTWVVQIKAEVFSTVTVDAESKEEVYQELKEMSYSDILYDFDVGDIQVGEIEEEEPLDFTEFERVLQEKELL